MNESHMIGNITVQWNKTVIFYCSILRARQSTRHKYVILMEMNVFAGQYYSENYDGID